jgi:penicillin-binding protein 1C
VRPRDGDGGAPAGPERGTLFTAEACYCVAEALTRTPPGSGEIVGPAWKTGTSWGKRDAWTVAYTPRFTVGVWLGNFSGEAAPTLLGAAAARPPALEVLSWLDPNPIWPSRPAGIGGGDVCGETGLRASPFCPSVVPGRVLAADRRTCSVHRRFPVDATTGHLLCRSCLEGKAFAWQAYALWPPDIEAYLQARGKAPLPEHCPACTAVGARAGPRFLAPEAGSRYRLAARSLPVRVFSPDKDLSFFLDGTLLPFKALDFTIPMSAGEHALACVDSRGRSTRVNFTCVAE